MARPELDEAETRLLRLVDSVSRTREEPVVRGGEVMKMLGLPPEDIVTLLRGLSSKNLVTISGPLTADDIGLAVISLHPANRRFVRAL
jgi:hypothetical protein